MNSIYLDAVPTPSEIFASDDGPVPDRWRDVSRVGAVIGGKAEPSLLRVLQPGCVFLFPSTHWARLEIMCESLVPRPGELVPWKKFVGIDAVQYLKTPNEVLLNVTVHPWWESPEAYEDKFPGEINGPAELEHSAFRDALRAGVE